MILTFLYRPYLKTSSSNHSSAFHAFRDALDLFQSPENTCFDKGGHSLPPPLARQLPAGISLWQFADFLVKATKTIGWGVLCPASAWGGQGAFRLLPLLQPPAKRMECADLYPVIYLSIVHRFKAFRPMAPPTRSPE